ncbi:MAG: hypothetical protein P9E24_04225 [Candidatus Competibacter sp.]|nr:hypothetical protein [Candidatus Competibacter sp.]MDG4585159.1 hypothetical protein [Candidatus Competibacter sp.]
MIDLVTASSPIDLLQQLRTIDISVPLRTEGRTTKQCERWSICRLLATYSETSLLDYPLQVKHEDRPDFVLSMPTVCIGIEITEAVPENWARTDAFAQHKGYDNLRHMERFRPGEPLRSSDEINRLALGQSRGSIWVGDSSEREWAEVMIYFSLKKIKNYANPDFRKSQRNWLVIYENWPLPTVEEDKAASLFHQKLVNLSGALPFDKIFIECPKTFWEFTLNSYSCHTINSLWEES